VAFGTAPSRCTPCGGEEEGRQVPRCLDSHLGLPKHRFMAERAQAREVVEIEGAPHAVGVSHPEEEADVILRAIKAVE
jgi:pimeloyl-ACP methyl ester carboxylesterase